MQIISSHQKYNLGVLKLHKFARTRIIAIPDEDSHHSFFAGSLYPMENFSSKGFVTQSFSQNFLGFYRNCDRPQLGQY